MSLIGEERIISLPAHKGLRLFRFCVVPWEDLREHPIERCMGRKIGLVQTSPEYRNFDRIDGEPMDVECREHRIMKLRDNEKECLSNAKLVSLYAKRFGRGQRTFISPGSEKKSYSISEDSPQGAERMLLEFAESGHPIFRITSPLSRGRLKSKGHGKVSIHCSADLESIETIFRIITSVNQLSLCGAVVEMCEEYETLHDRSGQPVAGGQLSSSLVPSVIKTEVLLDCDDLAHKDLLLRQYGERVEKLSQQDNLSKDAGFLNVVEIGQYFMTKDTAVFHSFMQWLVVNTLFHEMMNCHNQKDGSKETPKLGLYWKFQLVCCMVSTELRSEFRL